MAESVLILMKAPQPGRVKTRLADALGPERAAALYREWIGIVLGQLQPVRATSRFVGYFAGGPREAFDAWNGLVDEWLPQPEGDLGERLAAGFEWGFTGGGPVVAIGTDCLEVTADLVERAFDELTYRDVVFGPARDGGYYLVGSSSCHVGLFRSIRWSTCFTLNDHLRNCRDENLSVALLPVGRDIDTIHDWQDHLRRTASS